jgi:hypothetical protein
MTKETNNIIEFPRFFDSPPMSPEDVQEKLIKYKESYSTELAEIIWENVLGEMARAGCQFDEDINLYFPSMLLVFEAIKSLHLQTMGVEHPLQEFAAENTLVVEADGEHAIGGFKIKDEKMVDIDDEMD